MESIFLKNSNLEIGKLDAVDKNKKPIMFENSPVILEWYKTTDHATMLALQKKALPVLAEAFADEFKDFLLDSNFQVRKEYAAIGNGSEQEHAIIEVARLDRQQRVEISYDSWKQWIEETAQLMENIPFTYFLVLIKNVNDEILGIAAFYTSPQLTKFFPGFFPEYTENDVLLEPIAIMPAAQGRGLARSLIFSILTLAPETKRILTGTRIWITSALAMYKSFGFVAYKQDGIGINFKYTVKN